MLVPCKECKKRFAGCHGECTDYEEYRHNLGIFNKQIKAETQLRSAYRERSITKYHQYLKRKKKK